MVRTTASGRGVARDSAALTVGTVVNGIFAYVFFALVTRGLGAEAAAPVAVLWTYWGACTAMVTFPVQHWIIRATHATGEAEVASALPRVTSMVAILALAVSVGSWFVRGTLFTTEQAVFPVLMGAITIGALFAGVVRGGLAAQERFVATGVALGADNVVRVLLGLLVLQADLGAVAIGVVLGLGAAVGLVWPSAYRYRSSGSVRWQGGADAFLGAIASGSLMAQLVLVGGPAVLALMGGSPTEVTVLFSTLALFRAPFLLGLGLSNQITGALTRWTVGAGGRAVGRYRAAVLLVGGAGAILAAVFGQSVGHLVVGWIFGADTAPPPAVAALVAAGSVLALANLLLSLEVIAVGAGGRLTRAWLAAGPIIAGVLAFAPTSTMMTVCWAFLAGEVVAFGLLGTSGGVPWRLAGIPQPGSTSTRSDA